MASILVDLGSTNSNVSVRFALGLDLFCDVLDSHVYVSTSIGDFVVVTYLYHVCFGLFMGF